MEPAPGLNVLVGPNGSGKTTVLEAIHILGRGRSFRDPRWRSVIQEGTEAAQVYGRVRQSEGREVSVGVEKSPSGLRIRVGGSSHSKSKVLIETVPLQIVGPESHRVIERGPHFRRQYLDWGVFHVEHSFYPAWQRYRRAINQRNQALRSSARDAELAPWESEIAKVADEIDGYRERYITALAVRLTEVATEIFGLPALGLRYFAGWRRERALTELLREGRTRDRTVGYTRYGPHRADLGLQVAGAPAAERVSRGQQKLLVFALVFAQIGVLAARTGARPLLLVDDLRAELDKQHSRRVMQALEHSGMQVWITSTDTDLLPTSGHRHSLFHVEHGLIRPVV